MTSSQSMRPRHEHDPEHVTRNFSGTIVTGGLSQLLFAGFHCGFEVVNPDPLNDLWICFTGAAAAANGVGCVRVQANGGAYWWREDAPHFDAPVNIIGVASGQAFSAWAW